MIWRYCCRRRISGRAPAGRPSPQSALAASPTHPAARFPGRTLRYSERKLKKENKQLINAVKQYDQ